MPGLRLKPEQVQRLCSVEPTTCNVVVDAIVSENFLCAKLDGHYKRLTEAADVSRAQPAKARILEGWGRPPARRETQQPDAEQRQRGGLGHLGPCNRHKREAAIERRG